MNPLTRFSPDRSKSLLRWSFRRLGLDVQRFRPERFLDARRAEVLQSMKIGEVLDVGANTGQFGALLRRSGFRGRIISFEPLGSAFRVLAERAERDAEWFCYEVGLAEKPGERKLNVSANSFSSSFLGMSSRHLSAAPDSEYVGAELVSVTTLDDIADLLGSANGYKYLKIDTQGYELKVLEGAKHLLPEVSAIEMEVSLVQLYDDQDLFTSAIEYVDSKGFHLSGLYPGYCDPRTGDMLQMDAIFLRREDKTTESSR